MVKSKNIESFISSKSVEGENQIDYGKRLAQLLGDMPIDISEFEYCPSCPDKIVLEFIEKPPSLCCPTCGISKTAIDINSSVIHDKEMPVHTPYTYRPRQHFINWIKRITGESNVPIEQEIIDKILDELSRRRIKDVNLVTWELINEILRKLTKKVDTKYNHYYQQAHQITNIIRGAPILTLSDARKEKLMEMFDIIYEGWERHKSDESSNFMGSAFVLQMCFRILGYPETHIHMFNMPKGADNGKEYDRICEIICKENNWPFMKSSAITDSKYSGEKSIIDFFHQTKPKEGTGETPRSLNSMFGKSLDSMLGTLPKKPPIITGGMKRGLVEEEKKEIIKRQK